ICNSSCVVLLFYTSQEVYTNFGMFSFEQPLAGAGCAFGSRPLTARTVLKITKYTADSPL
ncbi:hypothetical protein AALA82_20865, partial [Oscillospiraceae bacterium 50-16]